MLSPTPCSPDFTTSVSGEWRGSEGGVAVYDMLQLPLLTKCVKIKI